MLAMGVRNAGGGRGKLRQACDDGLGGGIARSAGEKATQAPAGRRARQRLSAFQGAVFFRGCVGRVTGRIAATLAMLGDNGAEHAAAGR